MALVVAFIMVQSPSLVRIPSVPHFFWQPEADLANDVIFSLCLGTQRIQTETEREIHRR